MQPKQSAPLATTPQPTPYVKTQLGEILALEKLAIQEQPEDGLERWLWVTGIC